MPENLLTMTEEENKHMLRDLEEAKKLAEHEQINMNRFINALSQQALTLITEIYADDLLTMESKGFIDINNAVSSSLTQLAVTVENAVYRNQVWEKLSTH